MGPTEFINALGRGQLAPAYLLRGPDRFLHEQCRRAIIEAVPAEARAWCLAEVEFETACLRRKLEAACQMPMLGGHSFFLFSDPQDFKQASEEDYQALEAYLARPSPVATVVFAAVEPDRRRRFIQLLEKKTQVVNLQPLGRPEAAAWIARYLGAQGVEIEARLAEEMAEKFESRPDSGGEARAASVNLLGMRTEVEKLVTARFGMKRLEPRDLEFIVSVREEREIGRLLAAIAERQCGRAMEHLRALVASKEPEALILWCIGDLFRQALKSGSALAYGGRGGWARTANPWATFEIARHAARSYSRDEMLAAMRFVRSTDLAMKSSWKDARVLLEWLVWRVVLGRSKEAFPALEPAGQFSETD